MRLVLTTCEEYEETLSKVGVESGKIRSRGRKSRRSWVSGERKIRRKELHA
jgi:hypothetical protein